MTGMSLTWLQRRAAAIGVAVAAGVTVLPATPAWAADTVVASAETVGESNSVEIYVRADLIRDSSNRLYATGYDVERHEYLRGHNVTVTLEQHDAAGRWVVVARAEGSGVEGASATTGVQPGGGAFRACTAARVDAGETVAVCTG